MASWSRVSFTFVEISVPYRKTHRLKLYCPVGVSIFLKLCNCDNLLIPEQSYHPRKLFPFSFMSKLSRAPEIIYVATTFIEKF